MIKEIEAKSIINRSKKPSAWFGVEYGMNIYRGCQYQCIYCDSRSECYRIDNFEDIIVKINAPQLLQKQLSKMRYRKVLGTGSMSDPYMPIEQKYNLTGQCLEIIQHHRNPLNICTKSNLILRDLDILEDINKVFLSVAITITTTDDALAKKLEPNAPLPSERLKALGILSSLGIRAGILMMPILPYIEDTTDNINDIVKQASFYGASFIIPSFGVTLRDRQRAYYYDKLDQHFPELRTEYENRYKDNYYCGSNNYKRLSTLFTSACREKGISIKMPTYQSESLNRQLSLFE